MMMAVSGSTLTCGLLPLLPHSTTSTSISFKTQNLSRTHSQILSSNSCLSLTSKFLLPKPHICSRNSHHVPFIFAAQSNIFRVIQTVIKTGKDGVEAGTNLVPDAVPRPVARLFVTVVATALSLFVLRSFLSTVFFSLGFMGFVYFIYLALNKDKGPKVDDKPGSTDEAIEEARKIMDKYK
ncbi:Trypacidin cluster transcriptional coactivator tpcD [Bienertia sinuspersici]